MTPRNLMIFIDSLPYALVGERSFLPELVGRRALIPGLGYSVNVKAEIFGGYNPDEVGYFNQWMFNTNGNSKKYDSLFRLLGCLGSENYIYSRATHKIVDRLLKTSTGNIPWRYLPYFDKIGLSAYEDAFPLPTIFSRLPGLKKILYSGMRAGPSRDRNLFRKSLEEVKRGNFQNLFVASADLDHIGHAHGTNSTVYRDKLEELGELLGELVDSFLQRNNEGTVTVISDHGMHNVHGEYRLDLESHFGRPGPKSYFYFVDTTILRIWGVNTGILHEMEAFFNSLDIGSLLTEEERDRYGVRSRRFGDLIVLLDEGVVFNPTFYGRGVMKAMHGYEPHLESQHGVFLTNARAENRIEANGHRITARNLFSTLSTLLHS